MNLCDNLMVYLKGLMPEKEVGNSTAASSAASTTGSFQGMKLLSRDDEDYAVLGGKKGKGKKKGGNNGKKEVIGHSMDTLSSFSMLQIAPPTMVSQIPTAVEALEQKKSFYQGIERGAVPTMAELAESRQGKPSGASSSKSKSKDYSLDADFPTLSSNGDAKPTEVEEAVTA